MPTREQFLVLQANGHIDPNERYSAEQAPTFDYSSNPAYRPGRQVTNWAFQGPFHVPGSAPFLGPLQRQQASRNGQAVASSQRSSNSTQPAHRTGMQYQLLVPSSPLLPQPPQYYSGIQSQQLVPPSPSPFLTQPARHADIQSQQSVPSQPAAWETAFMRTLDVIQGSQEQFANLITQVVANTVAPSAPNQSAPTVVAPSDPPTNSRKKRSRNRGGGRGGQQRNNHRAGGRGRIERPE